jgi:2-polyprenyl-3-methyl-5-hydroxy-6-metoxy-1,4-benzoquinol methylase
MVDVMTKVAEQSEAQQQSMNSRSACRFCGEHVRHTFADLGMSPMCESYISEEQLDSMEPFFPLHVYVCEHCWLVQLREYVTPEEIFTEYAYFSSYSDSWLKHARKYTYAMTERLNLNSDSLVVELASNDGYLLQYFVEQQIPVLGIEPAANVARVAEEKGVPTLVKFFGVETAKELVAQNKQADLIAGNNVLAQVPDLNDFIGGAKLLLKPRGVITMEFPHLSRLVEENQFDTIYHEHYSYFSLISTQAIFEAHGLRIVDVDQIPTHGGSLRIYARHQEDDSEPVHPRVEALASAEEADGYRSLEVYFSFAEKVRATKRALLDFLISVKKEGKTVVGYGAPGKGNTLLNYCGIRTDMLDYTVDRSTYKQGMYLPGTRIPIFSPEKIAETRPDYVLILPWNLKAEIGKQLSYVREWGGKLVVPIPVVTVLD